jgi:hypothetical protein
MTAVFSSASLTTLNHHKTYIKTHSRHFLLLCPEHQNAQNVHICIYSINCQPKCFMGNTHLILTIPRIFSDPVTEPMLTKIASAGLPPTMLRIGYREQRRAIHPGPWGV